MDNETVETSEEERNTPTEGEQTDEPTSPEETPEDAPEDMEPDEAVERSKPMIDEDGNLINEIGELVDEHGNVLPESSESDDEENDVLTAGSMEATSEAEIEREKEVKEPGMTDPYPTVPNPESWGGPSMEEYRQLKSGIRFLVSRLGGHVVAEFKEAFPLLRE